MRPLAIGIGAAGALLASRYGALFWRVIHGPDDGSAAALLFLAGALLSLVPALGVLVAMVTPPWPPLAKAWLAVAVLVLALVAPFAML